MRKRKLAANYSTRPNFRGFLPCGRLSSGSLTLESVKSDEGGEKRRKKSEKRPLGSYVDWLFLRLMFTNVWDAAILFYILLFGHTLKFQPRGTPLENH